jgi:hypothetical protein
MQTHTLTTPVTVTRTYNVTHYDFRITNIELGQSVSLVVVFYDASGNFQKEASLNLYGEEYDGWGHDDNYIFQKIEDHIQDLLS